MSGQALIPPPDDPPPSAPNVAYAIQETLRQAANFPTVIVRNDWLLGVIAVQQVQLFLYQLFAESNKPMPPTGPKQWSHKLIPRQRRLLQQLPVAAPTRQSVMAARQAAFTLSSLRRHRLRRRPASPGRMNLRPP